MAAPAVGKAQNAFVRRHQVDFDVPIVPPADRPFASHVALEAQPRELVFDLVIVGEHGHLHDKVNVQRGSNRRCRRIRDEQSRRASADEHELLAQRPKRRGDQFDAYEIGIGRAHRIRSSSRD